jgi:hypothetical protein
VLPVAPLPETHPCYAGMPPADRRAIRALRTISFGKALEFAMPRSCAFSSADCTSGFFGRPIRNLGRLTLHKP